MSDQLAFDPASVDTFRIIDWEYDPVARLVTLRYAFDDQESFAETIEFVTEPSGPGTRTYPKPTAFVTASIAGRCPVRKCHPAAVSGRP